MSDPRLISPPFSAPQCRFESVARFANDKGQEFFMVVRGYDEQPVKDFIAEVKVYFEVQPDRQLHESDEPSDSEKLELRKDGFEIFFGATKADGIDPPYILHFEIDPPIQNGEVQPYWFTDLTFASVTIRAVQRTIRADLFQGGRWVDGRTVDAKLGGFPPTGTVDEPVTAGESTSFYLTATGRENNSRYSLNGDVRKGAYESYP